VGRLCSMVSDAGHRVYTCAAAAFTAADALACAGPCWLALPGTTCLQVSVAVLQLRKLKHQQGCKANNGL
jgi:hypothetical protein